MCRRCCSVSSATSASRCRCSSGRHQHQRPVVRGQLRRDAALVADAGRSGAHARSSRPTGCRRAAATSTTSRTSAHAARSTPPIAPLISASARACWSRPTAHRRPAAGAAALRVTKLDAVPATLQGFRAIRPTPASSGTSRMGVPLSLATECVHPRFSARSPQRPAAARHLGRSSSRCCTWCRAAARRLPREPRRASRGPRAAESLAGPRSAPVAAVPASGSADSCAATGATATATAALSSSASSNACRRRSSWSSLPLLLALAGRPSPLGLTPAIGAARWFDRGWRDLVVRGHFAAGVLVRPRAAAGLRASARLAALVRTHHAWRWQLVDRLRPPRAAGDDARPPSTRRRGRAICARRWTTTLGQPFVAAAAARGVAARADRGSTRCAPRCCRSSRSCCSMRRCWPPARSSPRACSRGPGWAACSPRRCRGATTPC